MHRGQQQPQLINSTLARSLPPSLSLRHTKRWVYCTSALLLWVSIIIHIYIYCVCVCVCVCVNVCICSWMYVCMHVYTVCMCMCGQCIVKYTNVHAGTQNTSDIALATTNKLPYHK
jgi:hypothetical protein